MIISCDKNDLECNTVSELEKNVKKLMAQESAEIWVSQNGFQDDYPCIGILLDKNRASITYFENEETCFVTSGEGDGSEVIEFCDGQYEVSGDQIVDKKLVLDVLKEFFCKHERSSEVAWEQLY